MVQAQPREKEVRPRWCHGIRPMREPLVDHCADLRAVRLDLEACATAQELPFTEAMRPVRLAYANRMELVQLIADAGGYQRACEILGVAPSIWTGAYGEEYKAVARSNFEGYLGREPTSREYEQLGLHTLIFDGSKPPKQKPPGRPKVVPVYNVEWVTLIKSLFGLEKTLHRMPSSIDEVLRHKPKLKTRIEEFGKDVVWADMGWNKVGDPVIEEYVRTRVEDITSRALPGTRFVLGMIGDTRVALPLIHGSIDGRDYYIAEMWVRLVETDDRITPAQYLLGELSRPRILHPARVLLAVLAQYCVIAPGEQYMDNTPIARLAYLGALQRSRRAVQTMERGYVETAVLPHRTRAKLQPSGLKWLEEPEDIMTCL